MSLRLCATVRFTFFYSSWVSSNRICWKRRLPSRADSPVPLAEFPHFNQISRPDFINTVGDNPSFCEFTCDWFVEYIKPDAEINHFHSTSFSVFWNPESQFLFGLELHVPIVAGYRVCPNAVPSFDQSCFYIFSHLHLRTNRHPSQVFFALICSMKSAPKYRHTILITPTESQQEPRMPALDRSSASLLEDWPKKTWCYAAKMNARQIQPS